MAQAGALQRWQEGAPALMRAQHGVDLTVRKSHISAYGAVNPRAGSTAVLDLHLRPVLAHKMPLQISLSGPAGLMESSIGNLGCSGQISRNYSISPAQRRGPNQRDGRFVRCHGGSDNTSANAEEKFSQEYGGWGTPIFQSENDRREPEGNGTARRTVPSGLSWRKGAAQEADVRKLESSISRFRPRRIILVRHGQSEGNVDETHYTRTPDNKIALTKKGWDQALRCGERIRHLIESDGDDSWKVYFYVSPYLRTLQTLRGIGLAFDRDRIAGVREEPRLREQDFGNFQDRERMRVEKAIRLRYGRFFYRFPDGESAADVYDRVTGFRETLRADIDVGRFQRPEAVACNMNLVLVSHGLTLRVFLMRWYKWTTQQFEGLYNFANTGMMVMELGEGGRYSMSIHHSEQELRAFGMSDEMIADQIWQTSAKIGELNPNWATSGPEFFDHFDHLHNGEIDDYLPHGLSSITDEEPFVSVP